MQKLFSPFPIGFVLIISNLERFAIVGKRAKSYIKRADMAGGSVGRKGRLKILVYKDGIIADKYREVKNTLGKSCNKEMTREKSIRKKARCERT